MYFDGLRIQVGGAGLDVPLGAFSSGQVVQYDGTNNLLIGGPNFSLTGGAYLNNDFPRSNASGVLSPRQISVRRIQGANVTSNSVAYADITNLTATINRTGIYSFAYTVFYETSAAAEGIGLQLAFSGTANGIRYGIDPFTDPATRANLITATAFASGIAPLAVGPGAGVTALAYITGSCNVTAVGDLSVQLRAETGGANTATALVGSWGHVFAL